MIRRAIGKMIEWAIGYRHEITVVLAPGAKMPFHKYDGDAGYDLHSLEDVGIPGGSTRDVSSGVYLDMRERIWLEIKARSSTLRVKGLEVVDAVIDRDYRGEMRASVHNPTGCVIMIKAGERVVQVVPHRLIPLTFSEGELTRSERGTSGFGSTGGHGELTGGGDADTVRR